MIVIIEGIDRVGKTTLCNEIIDKFKDRVQFIRFRDNTQYVQYHNSMAVNTEKNNTIVSMIEEGIVDNIILDRFHITEFVYGAVDRHYKNEYMYDLDRRLAKVGSKDTTDVDDVDPGMSFDGHIFRDVVLIYMVPVDVKKSSREHGYNLERHVKWYDAFYDVTEIKNKIKVDYITRYLALDFIDAILDGRDFDAPDEPDKPSEESEFILKSSRIFFDNESKTFDLPTDAYLESNDINVYVNGLYMTKDVDYIIGNIGDVRFITFKNIYRDVDMCTLTYIVKKEKEEVS